MKVFVYGATGLVGSLLAEKLLAAGHEVIGSSRKPNEAKKASNLSWVFADPKEPTKGVEILEKVDKAFFVSPSGLTNQFDILNPWIEQAKKVKLGKFVLMTANGVEFAPPEAPFRKAEIALENSGITWNIIRPNWFMQNFKTYWGGDIKNDNKIYFPAGSAKTAFIDARDIASSAFTLLTDDSLNNQAITLSGKEAITHEEVAKKISDATGLKITYVDMDPQDLKQKLLGWGLSLEYAEFFLYIANALKEGHSANVVEGVKKITGKDPIDFDQFVKDYKTTWV